jgi:hypothetical protein
MLKRIVICAVLLVGLSVADVARAGVLPKPAAPAAESVLLAAIFKVPQAATPQEPTAASGSCNTFKWYRSCDTCSEADCQASCGSCTMCLNVVQFSPCVCECRCAC